MSSGEDRKAKFRMVIPLKKTVQEFCRTEATGQVPRIGHVLLNK